MPMSNQPIFAQVPYAKTLSLAAVSACTTRAPTATAALAAANIIELTPVSTNGRRIDRIDVSACSTAIGSATTAGLVGIWMWDGTTASLIQEIQITVVTPSATVPAFTASIFPVNLFIPASYKLFASSTVTTTASTNALEVTVFAGDY